MRSMHIHELGDSARYTACSTKFDDKEHKIAMVMSRTIGGVKQTIEKHIKNLN